MMDPTAFTQNIYFTSSEVQFCEQVIAADVRINCSAGDHNHGSSKVKLTDIVDFNWGMRLSLGHLIAIHSNGNYIAYGLKTKDHGMVRVLNTATNQKALIKGVKGLIYDIAFAYCTAEILLSFVDEDGTLFVYNLQEDKTELKYKLVLQIQHNATIAEGATNHFRMMWCPYVPTIGEDVATSAEHSKLLVFLHGKKAEIVDVCELESQGPLLQLPKDGSDIEGCVTLACHADNIVDASFSPDGTALATASLDGYVKFFQIFLKDGDKPRCLHEWNPHEGKALSSLVFIDDLTNNGSDVNRSKFWKFVVTGALNNAELKLWSCESWTCTQTLRFSPNPSAFAPDLYMKARLDMTGTFLLLTEVNNRLLYVLQMRRLETEHRAVVASVAEFLLPAACISFCLRNAALVRQRRQDSDGDVYGDDSGASSDGEEGGEAGDGGESVEVQMYLMQSKCLQECRLSYRPEAVALPPLDITPTEINAITTTAVTSDTPLSPPPVTDLPKLNELQTSVEQLIKQQQQQQQQSQTSLTLMTPDDFASPIIISGASPDVDVDTVTVKQEPTSPSITVVDNLIDFQQLVAPTQPSENVKENFASGGSSPSREVQEILSLSNSTAAYTPKEFFDNLSKIQKENSDNGKSDVIWPDIPKLNAIELNLKGSQRRSSADDQKLFDTLTDRISSLETLVRQQGVHMQRAQQEANDATAALLEQQQAQVVKALDTIAAASAHLQQQQVPSKQLMRQLGDRLQIAVANEIKTTVMPVVSATFEQMQRNMELQHSQKLNQIDQLLKTNIAKLFNNKSVADSLSTTVVNVVKPGLEDCYRDMMSASLIPSWEKVCGIMFQQIHNTFTQGTKEYTTSVERYMDRQWKAQDEERDIVQQMRAAAAALRDGTTHLNDTVQTQVSCAFSRLETALAEVVREEVRAGMRAHAAAQNDVGAGGRARAVTPATTHTPVAEVQRLLAKGSVESAFQVALSAAAAASDTTLVLYVCERVPVQDVFGGTSCLLQQHVLLSLIQQLAADLASKTEIKHTYLEESLLNLDMKSPITKEHGPLVLRELLKQLNSFISNCSTHKCVKQMRMLQMAAQSILSSS